MIAYLNDCKLCIKYINVTDYADDCKSIFLCFCLKRMIYCTSLTTFGLIILQFQPILILYLGNRYFLDVSSVFEVSRFQLLALVNVFFIQAVKLVAGGTSMSRKTIYTLALRKFGKQPEVEGDSK